MRACSYKHRVTLQVSATSTANSFGEVSETWTTSLSGIPAEVQTVGMTENTKGKIVKREATVQVKMRYRNDVTQLNRFLFGSRYLYIQTVEPDMRNRELTCICRESIT